ncbi:unnamed protein product, partial [Hymenolepis diminuta]
NDFTNPRFRIINIPGAFLFPEAQFRAYKITSKQVQPTCLLIGLTPEVTKLTHEVLRILSTF